MHNHTIDVTFEPNTAGTPGSWTYSKPKILHAEHPSRVLYRLNDGTGSWVFEHVAIGENLPRETDYLEVGVGNQKEMEFDGLVVHAKFLDQRGVLITLDGIPTRRMKMAIMLTVTDGTERHTSRDPQIVLEPDPPSGEIRIPRM